MDQAADGEQHTKPIRGFNAVGVFLLFGMTMASLAGTTLVWPGTSLDRIWELNPTAYTLLAPCVRARSGGWISEVRCGAHGGAQPPGWRAAEHHPRN